MWQYYSHTTYEGPASNPILPNDNLSSIVNGFSGTTPLQNHFVSAFTQKNHWLFYRVGYVPFTRNCIKIPNIFHEIGVQHLVQLYEESNTDLLNQGLHVEGIFDAETPTETKLRRK